MSNQRLMKVKEKAGDGYAKTNAIAPPRKQLLQGGPPPMSDSTPLNAAPSNWCARITNRARRGSGQCRFVLRLQR